MAGLMVMATIFSPLIWLLSPPIWIWWPPNWSRYKVKKSALFEGPAGPYNPTGYSIKFLPGAGDVWPFYPDEIRIAKGLFHWQVKVIKDIYDYYFFYDRFIGEPWPHPLEIARQCRKAMIFDGVDQFFLDIAFRNIGEGNQTLEDFLK